MLLDVIIPTFNRSALLARALTSLCDAERPVDMEIRVTVVDNGSADDTCAVVETYVKNFDGNLNYLLETERGKSCALNSGIASTSGDIVAMIDDDEEVSSKWFVEIRNAFVNEDIDFIGGPCLPRWGAPEPPWLPRNYRGVIGWVDNGEVVSRFEAESDGILMGGNSVIRRSVLERAGGYSTSLGRTEKRLLSCEDEDMYRRLLDVDARGFYLPNLVIYHFVPAERLTKSYHRSWCFWRGVSLAIIDRYRPARVKYLLGVPRYLFGNAARGLLRAGGAIFTGNPDGFGGELAAWDLAGFLYGRHFFRSHRNSNQPDVVSAPAVTSQNEDRRIA